MSTDSDFLDVHAPVRSRSVVDARGAAVRTASGNPELIALGLLDATAAPYGADSSCERDSTAALQQAINDARDAHLITFLPAGRYLISDTLVGIQGVVTHDNWPYGVADAMVEYRSYCYPCTLGGDRREGRSTLVLAPATPGFDDANQPKPLVYFWSREETRQPATGVADPARTQFNISFNQQILDLDLDLGGNAGAIGIEHQGAQTSVIAHVNIEATGAYAGLQGLCGSGGGTHAVSINGGRFGIYARRDNPQRGSQPTPVVSDVRLTGQTEAAVLYDGRGPLTLVGAHVQGAGLVVEAPDEPIWNGPLNVVDSILEIVGNGPAIRSTHPVNLHEVYWRGTDIAVANHQGTKQLRSTLDAWNHVSTWTSSAPDKAPVIDATEPPADFLNAHHLAPLPDWRDATNVRAAPYNAVGDGSSDDTAAIQRALDEHQDVFLPPGEYAVSAPLRLRANTRFFGTNPVHSTLVAIESALRFRDAIHPEPVVMTADDAKATTVLAGIEIRLPVGLAGAYALEWRAGRDSVLRTVNFERTLWDPDAPGLFHPLVKISGHGGGSWYEFQITSWWSQSPLYRHLMVDGTHEPLRFYMLNPEHARCEAQVEIRDASNIRIFACKGEGNYPVLWLNRCHEVQLFGYGGNGTPWPGWSLLRATECEDILFVGLTPQCVYPPPGRWTALGIHVGAARGPLLTIDGRDIGTEQTVIWHHHNRPQR